MLFQAMNANRLGMSPCPPLAARCEDYFQYHEMGGVDSAFPARKPVRVDRLRPGASIQEAEWFFSMEEDDETPTNLSTGCQSLYNKLAACRKQTAQQLRWHPQDLSTNCALRNISLARPGTVRECMRLRGLDSKYRKRLAKAYVDVVLALSRDTQKVSARTPAVDLAQKILKHA